MFLDGAARVRMRLYDHFRSSPAQVHGATVRGTVVVPIVEAVGRAFAIGGDVEHDFGLANRQRVCAHARIGDGCGCTACSSARRGSVRVVVASAAHASVAAAHPSSTATHASSTHTASTTHAVTAP